MASRPDSLNIIVPTIGRPSLRNTLNSFADSIRYDDLVVVISDGPSQYAEDILDGMAAKYLGTWVYLRSTEKNDWGHSLRNEVLDHFLPDDGYVWTIDDDDEAAPGAIDALRSRCEDGWTIFRMEFGPGHYARGITCWREPALRFGDIGTPMVLAPRCQARFGSRYEGDWDYVQDLKRELGEPNFDERVVALIRPEVEDAQA